MKKNSFRCFVIFKSGIGEEDGEFLLLHQRGCKKTFTFTEKEFRRKLTEYNYEANNQFQQRFKFILDNWYAIRDQQNQGIWFALLCFPNCNQEKVFQSLYKLQGPYLKRKDYLLLTPKELSSLHDIELLIMDIETNFYGGLGDGYITEEDSSSSTKKQNKSQSQSEYKTQTIPNNPPQFFTPQRQVNNTNIQSVEQFCQTIDQILRVSKQKQIEQSGHINLERHVEEHPINVSQFVSPTIGGNPPPPQIPAPRIQRKKHPFDLQEAEKEMNDAKNKKNEIKKSGWGFLFF